VSQGHCMGLSEVEPAAGASPEAKPPEAKFFGRFKVYICNLGAPPEAKLPEAKNFGRFKAHI